MLGSPKRYESFAWLVLPVLLVESMAGCASSKDTDAIQSQISDVQRQVLQVQMQSSSKEEIASLEDVISAQTNALLKSEADMQVGLESLSTQIDQLQAQLEDTNYRLAQLSQQIAASNQEFKSFRTSPSWGGNGGTPGVEAGGSGESPQTLYQTAYNDYLRGNYDLAVLGFRQYLESFPDTELSDNAVYWIGESYFGQGQYQQSIREFDTILNRYPRSDKTASAALKKGYAYLEIGEQPQGVVQLRFVLREFPGSDEANLARQRLQALGVDVD